MSYDQEWSAMAYAADHKIRAGAAAADAGFTLGERPDDVVVEDLAAVTPRNVQRGQMPELNLKSHPQPLPVAGLRLHIPKASPRDQSRARLTQFVRRRTSPVGMAIDEYVTLMCRGLHDDSLRQGRVAGLDEYYRPVEEMVDAANVILAVFPPPESPDAQVRDLYISYSDETAPILFAHGRRPWRLFLATLPDVRRLLHKGQLIDDRQGNS